MIHKKICYRCKEEKSEEEFNKHKHTKDKLNSWCKACVKAYNKAYRKEHREEISAYYKEYREENKSHYLYIIWGNKDKTPLYIGSTNCLSRLSQHVNLHSNIANKMRNGWSSIAYVDLGSYGVKDRSEMLFVEYNAISLLYPLWNKHHEEIEIEEARALELHNLIYDMLRIPNRYFTVYRTNLGAYKGGIESMIE